MRHGAANRFDDDEETDAPHELLASQKKLRATCERLLHSARARGAAHLSGRWRLRHACDSDFAALLAALKLRELHDEFGAPLVAHGLQRGALLEVREGAVREPHAAHRGAGRFVLPSLQLRITMVHPVQFRATTVHDDSEARYDVPHAVDTDDGGALSLDALAASVRAELSDVSSVVLDVQAARSTQLMEKQKVSAIASATKGHFGQGKHRKHAKQVLAKVTGRLTKGKFGHGEHRAKLKKLGSALKIGGKKTKTKTTSRSDSFSEMGDESLEAANASAVVERPTQGGTAAASTPATAHDGAALAAVAAAGATVLAPNAGFLPLPCPTSWAMRWSPRSNITAGHSDHAHLVSWCNLLHVAKDGARSVVPGPRCELIVMEDGDLNLVYMLGEVKVVFRFQYIEPIRAKGEAEVVVGSGGGGGGGGGGDGRAGSSGSSSPRRKAPRRSLTGEFFATGVAIAIAAEPTAAHHNAPAPAPASASASASAPAACETAAALASSDVGVDDGVSTTRPPPGRSPPIPPAVAAPGSTIAAATARSCSEGDGRIVGDIVFDRPLLSRIFCCCCSGDGEANRPAVGLASSVEMTKTTAAQEHKAERDRRVKRAQAKAAAKKSKAVPKKKLTHEEVLATMTPMERRLHDAAHAHARG